MSKSSLRPKSKRPKLSYDPAKSTIEVIELIEDLRRGAVCQEWPRTDRQGLNDYLARALRETTRALLGEMKKPVA